MNGKAFAVLIRREFWEHRMLWVAPLVAAVLYLLLCLVPGGVNPENVHVGRAVTTGSFMLSLQAFVIGGFFALAAIVLFFYLVDCLYAERKDRSILFWKSLPVSDSATVLSKVVVALFIVPIGVFVLAAVVDLLGFGILYARLHGHAQLGQMVSLDFGAWMRMMGVIGVDILIASLWYAPLAGYQLLVSAWARSSPFVWTILPPLAVVFAERLVFGTWNVLGMLASRMFFGTLGVAQERRVPRSDLLTRIDAAGLLREPEFWIGIAIAALLIFAAIRIRRYRDDT